MIQSLRDAKEGIALKTKLRKKFDKSKFERSDWIVLRNSEILITTGIVWPVSYDKWKAPLQFVTIEKKKSLGRVNFRKGVWEKIGQ